MLNASARVVSGTHKFGRGLSRLLHTELHWLNVPERVAFKPGLMVFNCLHNQAPQYLVDLCQSVCSVASRKHLRSVSRGLLVVSGAGSKLGLVRRVFPSRSLSSPPLFPHSLLFSFLPLSPSLPSLPHSLSVAVVQWARPLNRPQCLLA